MSRKPAKAQSLGERIRKMREGQNLDLSQLAQRVGFDPEYLKEIEEGKISPPVGTLIQISRGLAVDSASLLAEEKKRTTQAKP